MEVVSCFVEAEGKILLLHRHDNRPQGNTWAVPAGKVEKEESIHEAIAREIHEELSLEIEKDKLAFSMTTYVKYPEYDFIYHIFSTSLENIPEIILNPNEHKNYFWITPKEALAFDLIPGEAECIKLHYDIK